MAAGTDAGNIGTLHGPAIHRELELLAGAGLTPMQVLLAATRDAAYAYEERPNVGVLVPGAGADLLVLEADPLADLHNLTRIERIYARGVGYDPAAILPPSPEAVVQHQLERFNAHDIDGFVSTYAPDAELFFLPDAAMPRLSGADEIRAHYGSRFGAFPLTQCPYHQPTHRRRIRHRPGILFPKRTGSARAWRSHLPDRSGTHSPCLDRLA